MPSTIPATLLEKDNGDGTATPLPGISVKVWSVAGAADVATVSTDANGYFPATGVSGAVGSTYRLRVENYQGLSGFIEVLSV